MLIFKIRVYIFMGLIIFSSCTSVKYFVVRHAEKATASEGSVMFTSNDPPLSPAGKVRANDRRTPLFGAAHDFDMGIAQRLAEGHQLTGMHIQIIEQAG